MLRFNKGFGMMARLFSGAAPDPNLPRVVDTVGNKQLRDKLHLQYADEADKEVLYEQSRVRKSTALYNLMTYLPNNTIKLMNKFVSDPKVQIRSDSLYLPRISANGVPIYDSFRVSKFAVLLRNLEFAIPVLGLLHLHNPGVMFIGSAIAYFGLYRPSFGKFFQGFVLKMELAPETEQILFQKVGFMGCITTSRIKTDDLQIYDRQNLSPFFYRVSRSWIDKNLIFRVKSTGEILFFDPEGCWYEQGINHQLLI